LHASPSIGRVTTALAALLAGLVVQDRFARWQEANRQRDATIAIAGLGQALVELSLERSLVQVTFQLPDPLNPARIEAQRRKAAAGFATATSDLLSIGRPEPRALAAELRRRLDALDTLRRAADDQLQRPPAARDPAVLPRWAAEVPAVIAAVTLRERVQQLAWAAREHRGASSSPPPSPSANPCRTSPSPA
jgi:hypothetical protein